MSDRNPQSQTPKQSEANYRKVSEGGVLKKLENGLMIPRRRKHEWLGRLDSMTSRELQSWTDPIQGSKFLQCWTLSKYVSWLELKLAELKWDSDTVASEAIIEAKESIGYSKGKLVRKIRIVLSSKCVHAFPVEN